MSTPLRLWSVHGPPSLQVGCRASCSRCLDAPVLAMPLLSLRPPTCSGTLAPHPAHMHRRQPSSFLRQACVFACFCLCRRAGGLGDCAHGSAGQGRGGGAREAGAGQIFGVVGAVPWRLSPAVCMPPGQHQHCCAARAGAACACCSRHALCSFPAPHIASLPHTQPILCPELDNNALNPPPPAGRGDCQDERGQAAQAQAFLPAAGRHRHGWGRAACTRRQATRRSRATHSCMQGWLLGVAGLHAGAGVQPADRRSLPCPLQQRLRSASALPPPASLLCFTRSRPCPPPSPAPHALQPAMRHPSRMARPRWCWPRRRRCGSTTSQCWAAFWGLVMQRWTPGTSPQPPRWRYQRRWSMRVGGWAAGGGRRCLLGRARVLVLPPHCACSAAAGSGACSPRTRAAPDPRPLPLHVRPARPRRHQRRAGGLLGNQRGVFSGRSGQPPAAGPGPRQAGGGAVCRTCWGTLAQKSETAGRLCLAPHEAPGCVAPQPTPSRHRRLQLPCMRLGSPRLQGECVWRRGGHWAPHRRQRHAAHRHPAQRAALQGRAAGSGSHLQRWVGLRGRGATVHEAAECAPLMRGRRAAGQGHASAASTPLLGQHTGSPAAAQAQRRFDVRTQLLVSAGPPSLRCRRRRRLGHGCRADGRAG